MASFPSPVDVGLVAAMPADPVRNRRVTVGYHQFALGFRHHLGDDATWPAFAVWASEQAGRTVAKEDLLRTLELRLGDSPAVRALVHGPFRLAARHVLQAVLQLNPFERSSQAVSRGNIKVYGEIGIEFARYLERLKTNGRGPWLAEFLSSLPAGPPPGGKDFLKRAFALYDQAVPLPPGKPRSELVLFANALIGFHEQTRLQPEIEASIDGAALDGLEVKERLVDLLLPGLGWLRRMLITRAERSNLLALTEPLLAELRRLVREIVTQRMMVIELPGGPVRLGRDLSGEFPPELRTIDLPEAREFLARLDPTPDSLSASAATDWASFPERMHFIADLFRLKQRDPRLFETPPAAESILT